MQGRGGEAGTAHIRPARRLRLGRREPAWRNGGVDAAPHPGLPDEYRVEHQTAGKTSEKDGYRSLAQNLTP